MQPVWCRLQSHPPCRRCHTLHPWAQWRSFIGARGAPLANENLHRMNSKTATVYYCSKRVTPSHSSEIRGQAPPVGGGGRGTGGEHARNASRRWRSFEASGPPCQGPSSEDGGCELQQIKTAARCCSKTAAAWCHGSPPVQTGVRMFDYQKSATFPAGTMELRSHVISAAGSSLSSAYRYHANESMFVWLTGSFSLQLSLGQS